jgi:hypothetical protein
MHIKGTGDPQVPDGDVQDLLTRDGRTPTEIAAATVDASGKQRLAVQGAWKYMTGQARYLKLPSYDTIMGLSDALRLHDDIEVLLAFARSSNRLRVPSTRTSELVLALRPNVTVLDPYPDLVHDLATAISDVAKVVNAAERSQEEGLAELDDLRKRLGGVFDRITLAVASVLVGKDERPAR